MDTGFHNIDPGKRRFHAWKCDVRLCPEFNGPGYFRVHTAFCALHFHVYASADHYAGLFRRYFRPLLQEEDYLYAGFYLRGTVSTDGRGPLYRLVFLPALSDLLFYTRIDREHLHGSL